ncbi:uncharacterized protein LOC134814269 [Bolinopsis microptera]|uniref:uncharacterized protein LOC134814269 n=1 Tax=Bolinopsis microptera TaxID=2820187 RepID=UPI00307AE612
MSLNIVVVTHALALLAISVASGKDLVLDMWSDLDSRSLKLVNAQQSSTYKTGYARKAIDGNTSGWYSTDNSCTHTGLQVKPSWQADFAEYRQAAVHKVIVSNRVDCCSDRLSHVKVYVDDHLCGTLHYRGGTSQYPVDCGGAVGSRINIVGKDNVYLTLCEVRAFGVVETRTNWRNDNRCGKNHRLPDGAVSICNPNLGEWMKCSQHGYCYDHGK